MSTSPNETRVQRSSGSRELATLIRSFAAIRTPITLAGLIVGAVLYVLARLAAPGEPLAILLSASTAIPMIVVGMMLSPQVLDRLLKLNKTLTSITILLLLLASLVLAAFYAWVIANKPQQQASVSSQVSIVINNFNSGPPSIEKCEQAWFLLSSILDSTAHVPDNFYSAAIEVAATGEQLAPFEEKSKWTQRLIAAAALSGEKGGLNVTAHRLAGLRNDYRSPSNAPRHVEMPNPGDMHNSKQIAPESMSVGLHEINDLGMTVYPESLRFVIDRQKVNRLRIDRPLGALGDEIKAFSPSRIELLSGDVGAYDKDGQLFRFTPVGSNLLFNGPISEADDLNLYPKKFSWVQGSLLSSFYGDISMASTSAEIQITWCESPILGECTGVSDEIKTRIKLVASDCESCR